MQLTGYEQSELTWVCQVYGANFGKLQAIKKRLDPKNKLRGPFA